MAFEKYSRSGLLLYAIPLYCGPFLSGLTRAPWTVVPVYAAIFTALILRTRPLPDNPVGLTINATLALLLNMGVAGAIVWAAHLVTQLTGPVVLPLWLPVLISALAAAFGMWRYRYTDDAQRMRELLDAALKAIEGSPAEFEALVAQEEQTRAEAPISTSSVRIDAAVARALAALRALPQDYSIGHVDQIVQDLEMDTHADGFHGLLLAADGDERIEFALMRYACSPFVRRLLSDRTDLIYATGLALDSTHARVRNEGTLVMWTMLDEEHQPWMFPSQDLLEDAAAADPERFRDLADAVAHYRKARSDEGVLQAD